MARALWPLALLGTSCSLRAPIQTYERLTRSMIPRPRSTADDVSAAEEAKIRKELEAYAEAQRGRRQPPGGR